ncbi:hypothetical protein BGX24_009600 [Mortierella sp. AD032]|nr:hypothetical protein BGX24_009600 [Mortierella sp. AD032]
MAVQNKKHNEERVNAIQSGVEHIEEQLRPSQSSLKDIKSALETYHSPNLKILRISGDVLDIDTCFVNLAIVEAPAQREKEKQERKKQDAVFNRFPSSEAVRGSNIESSIRLEQLFDKRKLSNGNEGIPQRILVQGRAGIGKTTLCKKIVHLHQSGFWADRFEAVLWLPLRRLRGSTCRTLESLLRENVFTTQLDREHEELARTLAIRAGEGKVLFILDGLDEIVTDAQSEDSSIKALLRDLLDQKQVVITSRPSGLDTSLLQSIDLELETIGFSQLDVKEFIDRVLKPGPAQTVQDFIRRTPLIQGLVNIPVQLDVICFCWESLPQDGSQITITGLYQLMSRKLWRKDALRLKKKGRGGEVLTENQIKKLSPKDIDQLMSTESRHLGHLAFKGLRNKHQIEFDEAALLGAFDDLADTDSTDDNTPYSSEVLERVKETSFLHSVDADLDTSKKPSQQTWSFLHLTFQEYFAATWIASKLTAAGDYGHNLSAGSMKTEPTVRFVQEHKYNPRFEIVWWMVAGLLEGEALEKFFDLLQGGPRDLIGGRHQQLLASCLDEVRARLNPTSLDPVCSRKSVLLQTLGARSTLSESAIRFLIATLKDEDVKVRGLAASALGKQSTLPESAIQSLIATLKDENANVRGSAASALGGQSTLPESAIQSLIATLEDEDANVRGSAVLALYRQSTLPESAIHSLIATLKDKTIQSLIATLKDEDANVRWSAALALSDQSTLSESAIQSLIATLKDEDPNVRSSAASALDKQSTLPELAIQSLIAALKDEDAFVRRSAVSALDRQSTLPESAIQSLIATLEDEDADVRSSAASALGSQSTLPESAIQSLIATLKDENANVRRSVGYALGNQSTLPESTIQSLIAILKDENAPVRRSAVSALGGQSTLSESTMYSLIATLKDENAIVRMSAAYTLGNQSTLPESAIQSLIATLKDEDADVRRSAASTLGRQSILPESAIQFLIATLRDKSLLVRSSANEAISNRYHSLLTALPSLSKDELVSLYKDHLFHYSCKRIVSLQVQDGKLHLYTEQGLLSSEHIEPDKLEYITSTFETIQQAEIHAQGVLHIPVSS